MVEMAGADLMVKEVTWPELQTFELKPYFYTDDGIEVIFRAPVNGATTSGSTNPRSEMRQMNPNGGDEKAWSNSNETWYLQTLMRFRHLPDDPSDPTRGVVGMQCHDGKDDITTLRLEHNGDLYVTDGDDSHAHLVNGSYALMDWMTVLLEARKGGGFYWSIDGTHVATVSGIKSGCYMKWGCYTQRGPNSTGYGETGFKSAKVWGVA